MFCYRNSFCGILAQKQEVKFSLFSSQYINAEMSTTEVSANKQRFIITAKKKKKN